MSKLLKGLVAGDAADEEAFSIDCAIFGADSFGAYLITGTSTREVDPMVRHIANTITCTRILVKIS